MAHIERRGKDRWRARYRAPDGRERSKTFPRRVDAEKFLVAVERSKHRGDWIDPALGTVTLTEWSKRWFDSTIHLKPKTRAGYASLLRAHILPRFGSAAIAKIDALEVREWAADLSTKLSAARTRQGYLVLSMMMKSAVESGYIGRSPCVGVRLPRMHQREMLFLSAPQVDQLVAAAPADYRTLLYLLAYCGLRWGEAIALRRARCDMLRGRVEISESLAEVSGHLYFGPTKTYERRWVILPQFLKQMLEEHLDRNVPADPDALVFTAPEGGPIRHGNFRRKVWLPALRPRCPEGHVVEAGDAMCGLCGSAIPWAAQLPPGLRIHDLRHTCAAMLIAAGAHPKMIQSHLGHSSIQVTFDRYGHLFPDEMDRLADALDATFRDANSNLVRPGCGLAETPS